MLPIRKHPRYAAVVFLTDTATVFASFLFAYYVRFSRFLFPPYKIVPSLDAYLHAMVVVIPIYLLIFRSYQLYRPERHVRRIYELLNVVKAVTMAAIFLMALTFIYREFSYSRVVLLFAWIFSAILCSLGRYILIQFEYFIRSRKSRDHVLIVGANRNTRNLIQWSRENPHYGQEVVGIITSLDSNHGKHVEGVPILGNVANFETIIQKYNVGEVILADPTLSRETATQLMLKCENKMIDFKLVADFYGLMTQHVDVEYISNVPLLGLRALPLDDPWNRFVKRFFDLIISIVFLVLLSPFSAFIALAIKLSDPGPIFYGQERVGQDEKKFTLYKFRSMPVDAETKTGPVWTKQDDQRITKTGKFLRQTNLDELPQLWNVLKGDMSLVGPRPERPHFVKQFRDQVPRYMTRHKIKSGLTGWAQIHGLRGNTSLEERIKYDLYYMENWTLMLDFEILFATIFAFKNAY